MKKACKLSSALSRDHLLVQLAKAENNIVTDEIIDDSVPNLNKNLKLVVVEDERLDNPECALLTIVISPSSEYITEIFNQATHNEAEEAVETESEVEYFAEDPEFIIPTTTISSDSQVLTKNIVNATCNGAEETVTAEEERFW